MSDNDTNSTSTGGTTNPSTTVHSPPPANGSAQPQSPEGDSLSTALANERVAHAELRRQHGTMKGEFETQIKQLTTEKEGLTSRATAAEQRALKAELRRSLSAAGALDIDVVASSADFSGADIEKIDELVDAFKKTHPNVFRNSQPGPGGTFDGGARGSGQPPGRSMNDLIRRATGRAS